MNAALSSCLGMNNTEALSFIAIKAGHRFIISPFHECCFWHLQIAIFASKARGLRGWLRTTFHFAAIDQVLLGVASQRLKEFYIPRIVVVWQEYSLYKLAECCFRRLFHVCKGPENLISTIEQVVRQLSKKKTFEMILLSN